jgi:hypothetical protein
MAYERTKLMATIPSAIIKKIGSRRWFLTMAPSDKYDVRTIEVIQDAIMDGTMTAWCMVLDAFDLGQKGKGVEWLKKQMCLIAYRGSYE